MTIQASVHDAKTRFSQLLERAHAGEEVIVAQSRRLSAPLATCDEAIRAVHADVIWT